MGFPCIDPYFSLRPNFIFRWSDTAPCSQRTMGNNGSLTTMKIVGKDTFDFSFELNINGVSGYITWCTREKEVATFERRR